MTNNRLLGIEETAEHLGITPNTLYAWVSQKRIPYVKIGRLLKFDPRDIETWIEGRKVKAISYE